MDLSTRSIEDLQAGIQKAGAAGRDDVVTAFRNEIQARSQGEEFLGPPTPAAQRSRGAGGDFTGGLLRGALNTVMLPADVATTAGNLGIMAANQIPGVDIGYMAKPSSVVVPAIQDLGFATGSPTSPAGFAGDVLGGSVVPGMGAARHVGNLGSSMGRQGVREAAAAAGAAGLGATSSAIAPESDAGRFAATLLGGALPQGMSSTIKAAGMGPLPIDERRANLAAFKNMGMEPTVGMVSGPGFLESVSAKFPGGYGQAQRTAAELAEGMETSVGDLSRRMAGNMPLAVDQAGGTIQGGIGRWADDFRAEGKRMYDDLYDAIESRVPETSMANTQLALTELVPGGFFADLTDNPEAKRLLDKFTDPTADSLPTFGDAKKLRTWLGNKMSSGSPTEINKFDKGELNRLYGAITKDLEEMAETAGVPEQFAEVNQFWSDGRGLLERYLDPLNAERITPEAAFKRVQSGIEAGPTIPENVLGALSPDDRGHVLGTVLDRMGTPINSVATPDTTFSNNTFLTNINKANKQGGLGAALGMDSGTQEIEDMARVSGRIREAERFGYNPSGTSQGVLQGLVPFLGTMATAMAGAGGSPEMALTAGAITGGSMAGAASLQKALKNQRIVDWAAELEALPSGQYQSHMARLWPILDEE